MQERADEPLFQVQLTRYKCGGLVIGTVSQHLVADGQSMSIFFTRRRTQQRCCHPPFARHGPHRHPRPSNPTITSVRPPEHRI
jgi:hypothetical protein